MVPYWSLNCFHASGVVRSRPTCEVQSYTRSSSRRPRSPVKLHVRSALSGRPACKHLKVSKGPVFPVVPDRLVIIAICSILVRFWIRIEVVRVRVSVPTGKESITIRPVFCFVNRQEVCNVSKRVVEHKSDAAVVLVRIRRRVARVPWEVIDHPLWSTGPFLPYRPVILL